MTDFETNQELAEYGKFCDSLRTLEISLQHSGLQFTKIIGRGTSFAF
ncbi:hypothetical protein ES707_21324 [subsurface metagenome]